MLPVSSALLYVLCLFELFYNTQCNLHLTLATQANPFHHPQALSFHFALPEQSWLIALILCSVSR